MVRAELVGGEVVGVAEEGLEDGPAGLCPLRSNKLACFPLCL